MTPSEQGTAQTLTRETILRGLQALSDALGTQGVTGEVCLFGGTVMVPAFNARLSTKDVDALFQPAQTIRAIASRIADEQHLPAITRIMTMPKLLGGTWSTLLMLYATVR